MSEGNGYATKESLLTLSRKPRRYADVEIPGFGKIQVQTINAAEFCRIDAAKNRVILLAQQPGKIAQQATAIADHLMEVAKAGVSNPVFTEDDRELLLSIDNLLDDIREAVLAHCNITEADLGAAQKKLPEMSGSSAPTGSGST